MCLSSCLFHSEVRDECLSQRQFKSVAACCYKTLNHRNTYLYSLLPPAVPLVAYKL